MEADDVQSTIELAADFNVNIKTILADIQQIGRSKSSTNRLSGRQSDADVEACFALLNRHRNKGILNDIDTCGKTPTLYDRNRKSRWVEADTGPMQCPRRKLTPER